MAEDWARGARIGWVGLAGTLALFALSLWVALATRSFAAGGAAAHLGAGVWVWLGVLIHERRRARAHSDRLELQRLNALSSEGRRSLFEGERARTPGDAGEAVDRFTRIGVPVLAVLTGLSELALCWFLFSVYPVPPLEGAVEQLRASFALPGAAALCGSAFVLLLLGRYAFTLAADGVPSVAGGGRRATSAALVMLLAGLALAAQHSFGVPQADLIGYAFAAVEGLLGLEVFALLLLEVYRPRRAGEVARPPYDSRLLGLLSAPKDLARTIAHAVDYQFGFGISQTWFYRFLQRRVVPLALFALLAFWILSVLVVVGPGEQGVVRRFGVTRGPALSPGLHLKLPWPIDSVQRVPSGRLNTLVTGRHLEHQDGEDDERGEPEAILWTQGKHVSGDGGESLVLLARKVEGDDDVTPVNLLAASASVDYETTNLQQFVHGVQDPQAVLEVLAERELSFLLSGEDLDALLRQRRKHAAVLHRRLQRSADALGLGLTVRGTSLTDLHPPLEVGEAFEAVTVALERSHASVLEAQVHKAKRLPQSRSEAEGVRSKARQEAHERVVLAEADATRFEALREVHHAAPGVWRNAHLLDRLVAGTKGKRKILIGRDGGVLIDLNLQDKVTSTELGIGQSGFVPKIDSGDGAEGKKE